MHAPPGIEPVAMDHVAIRIERAKEAIGDGDSPHVTVPSAPSLDDFGARDLRAFSGCGPVDDALLIGNSAARRSHALAIHALMDGNRVAGHSNSRRR